MYYVSQYAAGPSLDFSFGWLTVALFLLGIFSILLTCVASVAVCCRRRNEKSSPHSKNENSADALCHGAMLIDDGIMANHHDHHHHHGRHFSEDDPDPDLIPNIRGRYLSKSRLIHDRYAILKL